MSWTSDYLSLVVKYGVRRTLTRALAQSLSSANPDDSFIIDIGASQYSGVKDHLESMRTVRNNVDFWIIPTVPGLGQVTDTMDTAKELIEIGVKSQKIFVVANMVDKSSDIEAEIAVLHERCSILGVTLLPNHIFFNDVYILLKGDNRTVFEIAELADENDWTAIRRAAGDDSNTLEKIGKEIVIEDLACMAAKNLRKVFIGTPIFAG